MDKKKMLEKLFSLEKFVNYGDYAKFSDSVLFDLETAFSTFKIVIFELPFDVYVGEKSFIDWIVSEMSALEKKHNVKYKQLINRMHGEKGSGSKITVTKMLIEKLDFLNQVGSVEFIIFCDETKHNFLQLADMCGVKINNVETKCMDGVVVYKFHKEKGVE